ncbi:MAG: alpha-amylase family glycosyl hydrolase, partial [Actinomycetota bacterium]
MTWETPLFGRPIVESDGDRTRWWLSPAPGNPAPGEARLGPVFDPYATALWFGPDHDRHRPHIWAVELAWPAARPPRRTSRPLVVYEAHVRGLTVRQDRPDRGTFRSLVDELPRLADVGVSVLELLPVHQFDPAEDNYWGYMPVVFGAVHQQYAAEPDRAASELAELISAAHEHDIEVWLDVVFNHTSEEDEHGPLHHLRLLGARGDDVGGPLHDFYVLEGDGRLANQAGTGNTLDVTSPRARWLVMSALDRLADLGVDGFRFDLATILARDEAFIRSIGDWAERRGVRLVAEAWDVVRYQVGRDWPDQRWLQWNGPFRDDVRSFLRGEPGFVWAMMRRIEGSPDLFDDPSRSVNFITAHDGFTMYDLVAYDHKHNEANGRNGTDGTDDNRSWNCGHEGDVDVPLEVMTLRRRQLRNAMTLLAMSAGVPMFVAGDEFARTQQGNNNAYNQDNEISWVDWERREDWLDHEEFVARLFEFRAGLDLGEIEFLGATGEPDLAHHSRSLIWHFP